ncbi:MAG: type VI secretion system contractile sheath domain-containing protein [bacterium]
MDIPSVPFKILAIAPFRPQDEGPWAHGPVRIDKTNIDQIIGDLKLSLKIPLPKDLSTSGDITLNIKSLKDFHPDNLIKNNPFLKNMLDAKQFIEEGKSKGLSDEDITKHLQEWPDLPIKVTLKHQKSESPPATSIDNILKMVAFPEEGSRTSDKFYSETSQIEAILKNILIHIFSNNEFRCLESTWQGLGLLIKQGMGDGESTPGESTLDIVPVSLDTLEEILNRLLASLIIDIPSLIIIDLPFDNSPRSIELLEKIADFSDTLLSPAICWIGPSFFHLDSWEQMNRLPYIPHYLDEPSYGKLRHLKETPPAKWLALACNRFLVRYPYGQGSNSPSLIRFNESVLPWVSPVWGLSCLISKSLARTGWPTRFTEWKNIRIKDMALHPEKGSKSFPTETSFAEERMHQLIKAGIIPLMSMPNQDIVFTPSEANIAGGSLSYQLFVSRITHFFLWCKDNFREDMTPDELEEGLKKAFSAFWEKTEQEKPECIEISAKKPDPVKPISVKIKIQPSRQVLLSGKDVEMEFLW